LSANCLLWLQAGKNLPSEAILQLLSHCGVRIQVQKLQDGASQGSQGSQGTAVVSTKSHSIPCIASMMPLRRL